jgi:hypothetical protein
MMEERAKNGAQPAINPDHLLHGNFELFETPTGSREMRFYAAQANKTVGEIKAWGMSLQALEVTLTLALKNLRQQRTGIVEPG